MCVLSDKIWAARMSTQRVNGCRICRICFSPSFLPSSLPTTFLPPFFPLHFFFLLLFPSSSASLSFSNSLGLTFISATCSLRLGNTPVLHLSGYFSRPNELQQCKVTLRKKKLESLEKAYLLFASRWTFWEGRSDFLLQIQRTTEGQNALLCWHL